MQGGTLPSRPGPVGLLDGHHDHYGLMMIMIIFTLANLIVAVLGRATVLLVGRVEESSSSPHCHVCPCRHYHLQHKLDLAKAI